MTNSRAQIIATVGPISGEEELLIQLVEAGVDVVRVNLSWATVEEISRYIGCIRSIENKINRKIPIVFDLPGPRVQEENHHSYDSDAAVSVTDMDKELIELGIRHGVDYFALSFVGTAKDVEIAKKIIADHGGNQKIIAKIERKKALDHFKAILELSDAVMIARGDLGEEVLPEEIPFIQEDLIHKAKQAKKPVIVATQMLFSMVENNEPTRAEVTDVSHAIMSGADAVMLSDETAMGKYPLEAVQSMERIVKATERHEKMPIHLL